MFCFFHRQRNLIFRKIFNTDNIHNCLMVVFPGWNNNEIIYLNTIIICQVIIRLLTIFKYYAAIDIICCSAFCFAIYRRIKYLAQTIETHKIIYRIGELLKIVRQSIFIK